MVVGYNDRSIKVFDLKTENVIATYKPQADIEQSTTDIDVLTDNTNFVAGFTDGMVLVGSSWSSKVNMRFGVLKFAHCCCCGKTMQNCSSGVQRLYNN